MCYASGNRAAGPSNKRMKLPIQSVTVRACARPAPDRLAAYAQRPLGSMSVQHQPLLLRAILIYVAFVFASYSELLLLDSEILLALWPAFVTTFALQLELNDFVAVVLLQLTGLMAVGVVAFVAQKRAGSDAPEYPLQPAIWLVVATLVALTGIVCLFAVLMGWPVGA